MEHYEQNTRRVYDKPQITLIELRMSENIATSGDPTVTDVDWGFPGDEDVID